MFWYHVLQAGVLLQPTAITIPVVLNPIYRAFGVRITALVTTLEGLSLKLLYVVFFTITVNASIRLVIFYNKLDLCLQIIFDLDSLQLRQMRQNTCLFMFIVSEERILLQWDHAQNDLFVIFLWRHTVMHLSVQSKGPCGSPGYWPWSAWLIPTNRSRIKPATIFILSISKLKPEASDYVFLFHCQPTWIVFSGKKDTFSNRSFH